MNGYLVVGVLGIGVGFAAGRAWGFARGRQKRAWNDFLGNKAAMTGLWHRSVAEWWKTVKVAAVLVGLLAIVIGAVMARG